MIFIVLKWVYRDKNLVAHKFWVEYLSFQGGDLLPLLLKYNTVHTMPPTPTDEVTIHRPSSPRRVQPIPVLQVGILETHQYTFVGCIADGSVLTGFEL